jgi:hypothetical protein
VSCARQRDYRSCADLKDAVDHRLRTTDEFQRTWIRRALAYGSAERLDLQLVLIDARKALNCNRETGTMEFNLRFGEDVCVVWSGPNAE